MPVARFAATSLDPDIRPAQVARLGQVGREKDRTHTAGGQSMTDRTAPHKPQEPLRHAYYLVNGEKSCILLVIKI